MADRYERDKDGTVTGKAVMEHPQEPGEPAPNNNSRPPDQAPANSTLGSRAKGEKAKPMPAVNPYGNSTLADRTKAAAKRQRGGETKQVASDQTEDKSARATRKG